MYMHELLFDYILESILVSIPFTSHQATMGCCWLAFPPFDAAGAPGVPDCGRELMLKMELSFSMSSERAPAKVLPVGRYMEYQYIW